MERPVYLTNYGLRIENKLASLVLEVETGPSVQTVTGLDIAPVIQYNLCRN